MKHPSSNRISFEHYRATDRYRFIELFTDHRAMKHIGDGPLSESEANVLWKKLTEDFYPAGIYTIWALFAIDDARYLGHASLRPRPEFPDEWEIGYILRTEEWGNGLGTEAAKALVRFGFEYRAFKKLYATVDDDHGASIHVLKKAGFRFERFDHDEEGKYSVFSVGKQNS
ncbi:MAG: N-acetyltransferase [Acidobacteria bacterium]|nr:MAG: N-acetyltransferase [Acidobacteriota bacterium]REJ98396.1 MAG: N-acetyltransferase [Acidobacteriota bacterium]REK17140.1 MAG: N-acetyltransferase [Acidobacteriota bacterium]REK43050.1 MAG: N-acetyltransferase [Acidobacteriota bacterium]